MEETPVRVVDCDVHPSVGLLSREELAAYAPEEWRDRFYGSRAPKPPRFNYYDPPDNLHSVSMRMDSFPPGGGFPCSDPDFAFDQLIREAGVDIGILAPLGGDEIDPAAESARKVGTNNWLADAWLDKNNRHRRWRGSISVTLRAPELAAREIERWAGHTDMVQVLVSPQVGSFGDPANDPVYEAACRHGLPVATHLMGTSPYERTPLLPVGNPSHWHDFMAAWPLLFVQHVMSLVFDGTFERHPNLRVVFIEGGFTWILPVMWRMDAIWKERRLDLPWVKRAPSEYVLEHVRCTSQPMDPPESGVAEYQQFLTWMDAGRLLLFSTDYPHWSYDDPDWTRRQFPEAFRERLMYRNALDLYGLPSTVPKVPDASFQPA